MVEQTLSWKRVSLARLDLSMYDCVSGTYGAGHLETTTFGQTDAGKTRGTPDHLRNVPARQKVSFSCVERLCRTEFHKTFWSLSFFLLVTTELTTRDYYYIRLVLPYMESHII